MKRYLLIRYQQGGIGHGARQTSVVEQANDAAPPETTGRYTLDEVRQVAPETALHEWRQAAPAEELPAPLGGA